MLKKILLLIRLLIILSLNLNNIAVSINLNNTDEQISYSLGYMAAEHAKSKSISGIKINPNLFVQGFKDNFNNKQQINQEQIIKSLNLIKEKQLKLDKKHLDNANKSNISNDQEQQTSTNRHQTMNHKKNLVTSEKIISPIMSNPSITSNTPVIHNSTVDIDSTNEMHTKTNEINEQNKDNKDSNNKTFTKTTSIQNNHQFISDIKPLQTAKQSTQKNKNHVTKKQDKISKNIAYTETNFIKNFLQANKKNKTINELKSGLQYEILSSGNQSAKSPLMSDKVKVHYRGTLLNGKEFDTSYNKQPAIFPLTSVIKGWQEALTLMKPNAKWKIFVPPSLAYGKQEIGEIPANSILIFEIELLEIISS